MIRPTRTIYDDPRFGDKREAAGYEDLIAQVTALRADAYLEGSAGFERLIFSRLDGEVCGVARPKGRSGRYWFRLLPTGSLVGFP